MSPARADVVNAVELAGRAGELEREFELPRLPRLQDAGALPGTRAAAVLRFAMFENRPIVDVRLRGSIVMPCQRCMQPCESRVDETASLMIVATDTDEVAGGYEPCIAQAERLSVAEVVEEQLLLAAPLVPMHESAESCRPVAPAGTGDAGEDRQRPFANLRELIDKRRS